MNTIVFLILRRMRVPLLVLIATNAVAVLGMVLLPGVDADGNPWSMDFFHAFYFVSYMATTIGFGEIPHAFTAEQRMWVLVCIYLTVVAWIYAIGSLLTLAQNAALRQALTERRFSRTVARLRDPFYVVCGYGDTGGALIDALAGQQQRVVVLDSDPEAINALSLANYPVYVPGLCADAGLPENLLAAGLQHRLCRGVVALTNQDGVNLHIAITSKLLAPRLTVICRAESREVEDNMASFNTEHIIDPFETFAERLFTALHSPCLDALRLWLTGVGKLGEPLSPPHGPWVLCGYGRFGKALYTRLRNEGIETTVIEATPDRTGWPDDEAHCVAGWGTEAVTLREARITEAVGIVAGTDHDTNNLSILMTAGVLNPDLFMVTRQNRTSNGPLFEAIQADIVAQGSRIVADRIRVLLSTPLLVDFMRRGRALGDEWARGVITRLASVLGDAIPQVWQVTLSEQAAGIVYTALRDGEPLTLGDLIRDPRDRERRLPCLALVLKRSREQLMLPDDACELKRGDQILFSGVTGVRGRMQWVFQDPATLSYICTGYTGGQGWLWRWWRRRAAHTTG